MAERIGRYRVFEQFASGGTATVHLARLSGPHGFGRVLAVKRLHREFVGDSELPLMLIDEARMAARIRSPFVVPTLDVVSEGGELLVVMEYVLGESLAGITAKLRSLGTPAVELSIAAGIMVNVLTGLHAAHELTDEEGEPLELVHRDVSPHNVLVGADGIARLLDFGIAKAVGRSQTTREGRIKGKLAYMSPEQMRAAEVDRRTDVFAASTVFWELLSGARLFGGVDQQTTIGRVLVADIPPPSSVRAGLAASVDAVVMKGLAREPADRWRTAIAMARAIEAEMPVATPSQIAAWVDGLMFDEIAQRKLRLEAIEADGDEALSAELAGDASRVESTDAADGASAVGERVVRESPATHHADARRPRRAIGLAAAFGLAALVAGAFAYRTRNADAPRSLAVASVPAHTSPATSDAGDVNDGDAGIALAAPVEAMPAGAGNVVAPSSASVEGRPRAATPRPRGTTPPSARPNCSQPYYFDEQGRKRYRRECLSP